MNEENVIRRPGRMNVSLSIKISREASKWLKDNNYSPTGIFKEGIKDLGYKGE